MSAEPTEDAYVLQARLADVQLEIAKIDLDNASKDAQINELERSLKRATGDFKASSADDESNQKFLGDLKNQLAKELEGVALFQKEQHEAHSATALQEASLKSETESVRTEVDVWKGKYERLLEHISKLESRMVNIVSSKSSRDADLTEFAQSIAETDAYLADVLNTAERCKSEFVAIQEATGELESLVAAKESELKLAKAKMDFVTDEDLRAKQIRILETTAKMESEMAARERMLEAEKSFMADSNLEEQRLSSELELFKRRLESVRGEFKDYKTRTATHITELKDMLVLAQDELGELQGSTSKRERIVQAAQRRLKSLSPWVGIEIQSGLNKRVRVLAVREGGPASIAGLRRGDVIEMANGEYTKKNQHFRNMLAKVSAGDTITFQVQRALRMNIISACISAKDLPFDQVITLRRIAGGIVRDGDETFVREVLGVQISS